ncbi:MAG: DUF4367 domain-containing protein [Clostridia bacterium]|nr:DUF4367 domain-containing protein [Clostridia bacterium]
MNKPTRNDPLDALLYASAKSAGQNERSQYESASPENTLTDAEKKKIIRRAKDPRNLKKTASVIMKRAAVIVLVILSVSFTCAMSVDSVREALWHSIFENGTYHINIQYITDEGEVLPDAIAEFKEPDPGEGYTRREIGKSKFKYHIEYDRDGMTLTYSQSLLKDYEFTVTEHYSAPTPETKEISVNGCDGILITTGELLYLNWHDNVYVYSLGGAVPFEELLRIAETLQ